MHEERNASTQVEGFTLGRPALVCRWRLAHHLLPLENRHLRALAQRRVNGVPVSTQLVAWAKQHIEWTLGDGSGEHPDGVLMLVVDERGQAAMSVGPYEPLETISVSELASRVRLAAREARSTGVSPETLWLVREGQLVWGIEPSERPSGAATLVSDLARAEGLVVTRRAGLAHALLQGNVAYDEAFLVSDEHGVVGADDAQGPCAQHFARDYEKLLSTTRR
ncbi:hypothetical protein [Thermophilibacter immobilis]|jgi:hypothetical protein|uniref:hypothetical protein n=1 Tax=Thermophilibacter immobilis TaxID=2779519 RepID=UPI001E5BA6A1|nr:hypothetical protein [Thermophilibacter immobilis]